MLQNDNLTEVADYTAYDAATNILKYQDMAAFSEKYRFDIGTAADQSVYGIVTANGTKASTVTYANGVSTGYSITTPSFKTAGASAYVLAMINLIKISLRRIKPSLITTPQRFFPILMRQIRIIILLSAAHTPLNLMLSLTTVLQP